MKLPTPVSPKELLASSPGERALAIAILTRPSIATTDNVPMKVVLEQEVEAVNYDAGAMIVRRFAWYTPPKFPSIVIPNKT